MKIDNKRLEADSHARNALIQVVRNMMKNLAFMTVLIVLNVGCRSTGTRDSTMTDEAVLSYASARLKKLNSVGGYAGFFIMPTDFLKLSVIFSEYGDDELFMGFISSKKPIICVMGLVCMSRKNPVLFEEISKEHVTDSRTIMVYTDLCRPFEMTIGSLIKKLSQDVNYLGHMDDYWEFREFALQVKKRNPSAFIPYFGD